MAEGRVITMLGLFIGIVTVALLGVAVLGFLVGGVGGGPSADIRGQSPAQFQPAAVEGDVDPETGEISLEPAADPKQVLVDRRHDNRVARTDVEPLAEALVGAGHSLSYAEVNAAEDFGDQLDDADALVVIQPTEPFTTEEREAVQEFVRSGGRLLILAEPTAARGGSGPFTELEESAFAADRLAGSYGFRVGSEGLYNLNDSATDNNFKSVTAARAVRGPLTRGAPTISLDGSGYVVTAPEGPRAVYTAAAGTRTLESRRGGEYTVAARTDRVVFVADTSLISESERHDADNEQFIGNLLRFLTT